MNRQKTRFFLTLLLISIISLIATVLFNKQSNIRINAPKLQRPTLPDDVERLIEKYTYRENDNGLDINISGNRITFRGKKMLGLRSNVAKTSFFETIKGTLQSQNALVVFSASDAEWELNPASPLILTKNVSISIHDKPISDVKKARIYFRQGVLEVTTNQKEIYHFR
jgi:hypothetical protein